MALVSPGLQISVIDDSQYVSTGLGTVAFTLIATAQNKLFNGAAAAYSSAANAGKLLAVTSQRDLITNLGYPIFNQSSAGTPLNANELNEYGLMTAYSAMGVSTQMFIMRADIDLAQLEGTSVRPIGLPANGTYWLDLTNTAWGLYEWNAVSQSFTNKLPLVITSSADTSNIGGILTPNASVGSVGSYAVIASDPRNYVFYKGPDNIWSQVGSAGWQNEWPAVSGTVSNPTLIVGSTMTINTVPVTFNSTTAALAAQTITSANIPGITAGLVNNRVIIYATAAASSTGAVADGKVAILDGTNTPAATMGIVPGTYASPTVSYGTYVSVPSWRITDSTPRPSGSVWVKTSSLGNGANFVIKEFNATNDVWTALATPIYADDTAAIYALDPAAGGQGIQAGTIYIKQDALSNGTVSYRPYIRQTQGAMKIVGTTPTGPVTFTPGNTFTITTTAVGSATPSVTTITLTGVDRPSFVATVLAANIANVVAAVETSGAISFSHTAGGTITLANVSGTPLTTAGFTSSTTGVIAGTNSLAGSYILSNFAPLTYTYSATQPYTAPADGTLWFFNSPLDVDIMINETTGWKGYQNVSSDARGYNLVNTDPNGPILAPIAPTMQSDNTPLVPGDLWVNTGDLVNFPVISRYTGSKWQLIDNTDVIDQNGIVFADARWDSTGTTDPAAGVFPSITTLLKSDYKDLDCPDHRLYPRGTLLFNLRRSGYNVKHYVSNYFNAVSFPNATLPTVSATWVTSSGLMNNGAPFMGAAAQRNMVIKALRAAINGSDTLREDSFQFNLISCPGYPELIPDMVALNNDRKNTAFIIGDTPMTLPADVISVTNWSTDANGNGLATADPYMGVYYPSGLSSDLQGNTIVVPPSHMVLRAAIKSDNVSYPWFAYAGTRRGLVDNATDIGYVNAASGAFVRNGLNQGMRDALYPMAVNPITLLPGVGLTIFGNKTRVGVASSLDRVNVARLVNYIRTILATVGNGFLFEPNDKTTWDQLRKLVSSAMNDLVTKRGIYDYAVVCDASNNTPDRIARNELYVDVAIEPMKDVEFIYIPIRLMNPGAIKSGGK